VSRPEPRQFPRPTPQPRDVRVPLPNHPNLPHIYIGRKTGTPPISEACHTAKIRDLTCQNSRPEPIYFCRCRLKLKLNRTATESVTEGSQDAPIVASSSSVIEIFWIVSSSNVTGSSAREWHIREGSRR